MIVGAVTSPNPLLAWLVASAGGVALYLFLLRRNREEDEDGAAGALMTAPALASAGAATSASGLAAAVAAPAKASGQAKGKSKTKAAAASAAATAPIEPPAPPAVPVMPDDSLPLAATLSAAAARAAAAAKAPTEARKFDKPPAKGVKRYTVAYRHVRISETTDEVRSRELGRLDPTSDDRRLAEPGWAPATPVPARTTAFEPRSVTARPPSPRSVARLACRGRS
jgi:hypothetical protein